MTTDLTEDQIRAAADYYGLSEESIRQIPRHEPDCALVTTHHLTCTCGAYGRVVTAREGDEAAVAS
jgi:hypothetical protein